MNFIFNPHPNAPLFDDPTQAQKYIQQITAEMESGNMDTANEPLRQLIRQAGYTNLWFWLKVIAGHAGPYDQIDTDLHLDICNFRQALQSDIFGDPVPLHG